MILARDTKPGSYYRRTRGQAPGDYYTRHRQSVRALVKRLRGKWNKNTATTRDVSNLRRLESSSGMVAMVRHSRGVDPFTGNPFTVRQLVVIPGDTKLRQLKRRPKLPTPNPPSGAELADRPRLYSRAAVLLPHVQKAADRMEAWDMIRHRWSARLEQLQEGKVRRAQETMIADIKGKGGAYDKTSGADQNYVSGLLKRLERVKSTRYRAPDRKKLEGLMEEGVIIANSKWRQARGRWKGAQAQAVIQDELLGSGPLNRKSWERVQPWRDAVELQLDQLLKTGETDEGFRPGVTPRARARWFLSPTYTPWQSGQPSELEKLEQTRRRAEPGTQLALFNPPRPRLQPYTSATSRKDALEPLAAAGWGLLFAPNTYSPKRVQFARDRGMPIVLDNGAWTAFQKGQDWRATYGDRFESVVELLGPEVEWVVAPDIVAGGAESLELSVSWLPWLLERTQTVLVPVQDGMTPGDLAPIIDAGRGRVGIFLGGSTEWKWATAPEWGELAARWGVPYHVARVNSQRALRIAATVGASSIDGSGPVRFPSMIERLERERAQETLELRAQPMPCCGVYADRFADPTTGEQVCMNCGEAYSPGYHWKYMDPDFSELAP